MSLFAGSVFVNSHLAKVSLLPKIRTHRAFVAICRHAQGGRECACPRVRVKQGDKTRRRCLLVSAPILWHAVLFTLLTATFLFWFFFLHCCALCWSFLFKMLFKNSAEVLSVFLSTRVRCFMEKICVLGKRPSGMSHSDTGCEFCVSESTINVE